MKHSLKSLFATIALLGSALLIPACSKKVSNNGLKVLMFGNGTEPATVDPHVSTGVPENRVITALFEGLSTPNPETLAPEPGVAESWTISKDLKTYTFKIRENAKWSNGESVTAEDFVFSWMRSLAPGLSEYSYMLYPVKNGEEYNTGKIKDFSQVGVKAVDPLTLKVELKAPTPYFITLLHHHSTWPVPRKVVEKYGKWNDRNNPWTQADKLVGNGPFVIKNWELNKVLEVKRSPTYWNKDIIKLDEIHFFPTVDAASEEREFRTGKLHRTSTIPPHKIRALLEKSPEETNIAPYLGTYYYRFNVTRGPMKDKRIRKALAIAIDRDSIVKNVTRGNEIPAYSFVPPNTAGFNSRYKVDGNIDDAKKLLADAGYPEGKNLPKIEILFNTNETHKDIAVALQQMWKQSLGINVELNNQEWKVYLDTQRKLDYDISRAGWIGDYNDPNTFLDMFTSWSGNNQTGWKNKEYDALILKASVTGDPAERLEIFQEAEKVLMEELPVLPIYTYTNKYLLSKKVKGYFPNILDLHPYQNMDLEL